MVAVLRALDAELGGCQSFCWWWWEAFGYVYVAVAPFVA
jgi:hypothetical protein